VTCVGEWHSHTAGGAAPSGRDLATWRRILHQARGRQHLFLIVSPRETNFVEGLGSGEGPPNFRSLAPSA
jgi:proteasome lid subunit RPN8/RPN11